MIVNESNEIFFFYPHLEEMPNKYLTLEFKINTVLES